MASNGFRNGIHCETHLDIPPRRFTRREALTPRKRKTSLEAQRRASLRYYHRHRKQILERLRRKRRENPSQTRHYWRAWMKSHPDARQRYKEKNPKYQHYILLDHLAKVEGMSGKCASCGYSNPLALAIHHKENGQLQVLCFNCHQTLHVRKRLEKTNISHPKIQHLFEGKP